MPYRLVAEGNTVYVTLGLHAPVSALDAETGEVLRTYEQTETQQQILLHNGTLILAVRQSDAEKSAKRGALSAATQCCRD